MILDARGIAWLYDNLPPEYKMKTLTKELLMAIKAEIEKQYLDPDMRPSEEFVESIQTLITNAEDTIDLQFRFDDLKMQYDLLHIVADGLKMESALNRKAQIEFGQFNPSPSRAEIATHFMAADISHAGMYKIQDSSEDAQLALKYADALIAELKK